MITIVTRRSGRTISLLNEAQELAKNGKQVCVVTSNEAERKRAVSLVDHSLNITIMTLDEYVNGPVNTNEVN